MSEGQPTGVCESGKVRYLTLQDAAIALDRVRAARAAKPDGRAPERAYYECGYCAGWHLTSQASDLEPPEPTRGDGETWENYALRLERRIKAQRDHLEAINALRADAANRAERKRIDHLLMQLGRMTHRWEGQRAAKIGLAKVYRELKFAVLDVLEQDLFPNAKCRKGCEGCFIDAMEGKRRLAAAVGYELPSEDAR